MAKQEYVVGFMFSPYYDEVILIEKQRPKWQCGRLNGVGGKIEEGESPLDAMIREFEEETGVIKTQWRGFAMLDGNWYDGATDDWKVYFYCTVAVDDHEFYSCKTTGDEEIVPFRINPGPLEGCLPNLHWLIPMALGMMSGSEDCAFFKISEARTL